MQAFRGELMKRAASIKRSGYLTELEFGPLRELSFSVTAKWDRPKPGSLVRSYSFSSVFRYTGTRAPVIRQSPCRFKGDLVRAILSKRGVL